MLDKLDLMHLIKLWRIMDKPNWDTYFLTMTVLASTRSIDPATKCGCVLVDKNHKMISAGYNGPIGGSIDSEIPMSRPEKYYHMIHAEANAILSSSNKDLFGATCYTNIRPCHDCLKMLLQCGVRNFVFMNLPNAKCVDKESMKAQEIMIDHHNVNFKIIEPKYVADFMYNMSAYFDHSFSSTPSAPKKLGVLLKLYKDIICRLKVKLIC